jgi:hypothetical protein
MNVEWRMWVLLETKFTFNSKPIKRLRTNKEQQQHIQIVAVVAKSEIRIIWREQRDRSYLFFQVLLNFLFPWWNPSSQFSLLLSFSYIGKESILRIKKKKEGVGKLQLLWLTVNSKILGSWLISVIQLSTISKIIDFKNHACMSCEIQMKRKTSKARKWTMMKARFQKWPESKSRGLSMC